MTRGDRIQFHSDRAMQELDRALTADNEKAARAHFGLSALHLDSMRTLQAASSAAVTPIHSH